MFEKTLTVKRSEPFKRCLINNTTFFVNKLFVMTVNSYPFINALICLAGCGMQQIICCPVSSREILGFSPGFYL